MYILDVEEFLLTIVLKKGISYSLQTSLSKQEMEHDEIFEDTWEAKENERLPHVKIDALSTAFCFARNKMGMEKLCNFATGNSLPLPSLANKYYNSLRDESDEPI